MAFVAESPEVGPSESETAAPVETPKYARPAVLKDGRVAVTDDDGETVQTLPADQVEEASAQGFRPASRGEYHAQKEGFEGKARGFLGGAARGVSFGASDPIAVAVSRAVYGDEGADMARDILAEDRDVHSTGSMVGEIGGSLLPLAFGAPPVEAAGAAGEGVLARAGSRALANAPRLLGEGAAFGLGHQLTEDTLGNHELVAGKYLAAGLEGGIVNLLLGSVLHAGAGALSDKLASRATSEAGVGERVLGKIKELSEEQAAKGLMPAAGIGASEMSRLGRTAEEQTLRMRQVGRTAIDEGISTPFASKAVQAERATKRVSEVGAELGAIRKSLDASAIRPSAESIVKRITDEVIAPLVARPFSDAEIRSVEPYVDEIFAKFGKGGKNGTKSFSEVFELRDALDDKLKKFWKMPVEARPAGLEEVAKVRRILEEEIESAADRAAADLGEDVGTKYRVKKALFSDLKTAEGWASKAAGKEMQHRAVSLTDTIIAGSGIASGHGALAVGGTLANKAMRTYGNQAAAFALDRIAKLEVLQRAAAAFDAKLAASTEAFFGKRKPAALTSKRVAITPEERVALRNAIRNPGVLVEHVGDAVARTGLHEAAPNVAGAMTQMVMRAAQWAAQKLPKEPSPVGASFGQPKPRALGPRGQAELDRAINALDTDAMLDDLGHRRLSREQVEALKFVNPPLYLAMRKSVRDFGETHEPDMTIQQEMALSIVFDTPVSSYTRGATIRGFQKAFAQGAPSDDPTQAGGSTGKPIGSSHSKAAESLASPTDRAEANSDL